MAEKNKVENQETWALVNSSKVPQTVPSAPKWNDNTVHIVPTSPENDKKARGSALRQVLAAFAAQLGTVNTGMVFGFSAIAIPQLKATNSILKIDDSQASWIASMASIGTPIGCLLSGYMMDTFGRKCTLLVTEVPALLGWILIIFATDIRMIYAGRFFVGLGSGMVGAPARVYTSEVTQPHLRGMLTALASVGVSTGVLIEYALGSMLPWHICAAVSSIIPLVSLMLMFLFPETPSYLISRDRPQEAKSALRRFRGNNYNLDKEMDALVNFSNKNNIKRLTGFREIMTAILKPNAIKPFILLFLYFLIYQWSGTNALTFYAVDIIKDSGATVDKYLATVILGVVRLASTIAACILCRRCGRRPLTLISSIGCGLSMVGLGSYMWLLEYWKSINIPATWTWVPIFCIFAYTITCTLGFLVIPWVMIGEVYPTQIRGVIGGITTMSAHAFIFTVVKTYPLLADSLTRHGTFILYGCISLVGTIYFYVCLPETKGKTLQEIEDYFSGRSNNLKTGRLIKPKVLEVRKGQVLP
ncbi:facilitated trehalose transporter Tret1 isoform X2 [Cephus cinctus]|uniref:Facilitated trehalose transporter Tret1 isoform X2 n=1 Tax=Cephus cinctus TaxID=211228 RepID=A0AAJ7FQ03_CEPCN|nr:facilitated trehalose transporter Tret1 isoform X2 [Cephus cinctus]